MKKRIPDNEKKKSVAISLHPELIRLLEKYSKETDQNRSKIIDDILKKHLLDIFKVGKYKSLGYEIIDNYSNNFIKELKEIAIENGLKYKECTKSTEVMWFGLPETNWAGSKCLYVYHEDSLKSHIEKYKYIYIDNNVPITISEFIDHIYKFRLTGKAKDVLSIAFGV